MLVVSWKISSATVFVGLLWSCSMPPTQSEKAGLQNPGSAVGQPIPQTHEVGIVPPEIVRSEEVHIRSGVKSLTVGNANGHYSLSCNTNALGCMTPTPGKNYLLFTKTTRWKLPGAKEYLTLEFLQDWTVTYNQAENIGLVPGDEGSPGELGMYWLRSWSSNSR